MKKKFFLYHILLVASIAFVFRFIRPTSLFWGDTPYFFKLDFKLLTSEISAWTNWGINFGGVSSALWLYPLMFLWGWLENNQFAIFGLFYLPAFTFSLIGLWLLGIRWKLPLTARFIFSFFYLANTYVLSLVDGGVLGIVLAYGTAPLTLALLLRLQNNHRAPDNLMAIIGLLFLTMADPRISIIIIMLGIWLDWSKRTIRWIPVILSVIGLSAYWLYPLIRLKTGQISLAITQTGQNTLINSIFLYLSHFPINQFGQITQPPWKYYLLPLLLVAGMGFKREKRLMIAFLFFAFLAKGGNPPLGGIYRFLVSLPFGFAFRDSSKFFLPLMLLGGLFLGRLAKKIPLMGRLILIGYLLILVSPAFLGHMNFVLSGRTANDYQNLNQIIKNAGPGGVVWFPEKPPLGYCSSENPSLNGRDLVNLMPFGRLNVGTHPYNYLNQPSAIQILGQFGVRYLVVDNDFRKVILSREDIEDKNMLLELFDINPKLRILFRDKNLTLYEILQKLPRFYVNDKLRLVIGFPELSDLMLPSIYLEDGKWQLSAFDWINPDNLILVWNGRQKSDLTMGFLTKLFIPAEKYISSQWSNWKSEEYLKSKWELLIRNFSLKDLDYGQGLAFSENPGEKLEYSLQVDTKGKYFLFARVGGQVEIQVKTLNVITNFAKEEGLQWVKIGELELSKESLTVSIHNKSKLGLFNTMALVPEALLVEAQSKTESLLQRFNTSNPTVQTGEIQITTLSPTKYTFAVLEKPGWIILNESYHPQWNLKRETDAFSSLPLQSAVNVFYYDPAWGNNVSIVFKGQSEVRWGYYWTLITLLIVMIMLLIQLERYDKVSRFTKN